MKYLVVAFMSLLLSGWVLANPPITHVYPVVIERVVDADTMDVTMEIFPNIHKSARVRVYDYDAPETWRPETEAERLHGQAATVEAIKLLTPPLWIKVYGWGVYNRIEADLILSNGQDYADLMETLDYVKQDNYN